jgi:hypothetical protein
MYATLHLRLNLHGLGLTGLITPISVCLTISTFRRRSGLFFWSLIGTSFCGILIAISIGLEVWVLGPKLLGLNLFVYNLGKGDSTELGLNNMLILPSLGYLGCIIGEYAVLYSRLHLFHPSKRLSRGVLAIITAETVLVEIPLVIMTITTTLSSNRELERVMKVWVPMEALVWGIVDALLAVVYILQVKKLWLEGSSNRKMRRVLCRLIFMCGICFCANVINTTVAFALMKKDLVLAISVSLPVRGLPIVLLTLFISLERLPFS